MREEVHLEAIDWTVGNMEILNHRDGIMVADIQLISQQRVIEMK